MQRPSDNVLRALEDTYSLQILALLQKEGEKSKTVIYEKMSSNARAALDRLRTLESLGLIYEVKRPSNPKETIIQLTKKGEKVAKHRFKSW